MDDLANHSFDAEAVTARLTERVENQGARINALAVDMARGFSEVNKHLNDLSRDFQSGNKTQWPVIWSAMGVCFMILFGIGGALYWPVREGVTEMKLDLRELTKAAALQIAEVQKSSLSQTAFQDFRATYENNRIVARTEYIDKFSAVNARLDQAATKGEIEDLMILIRDRIADLQRQLDEMKRPGRSSPGL